MHDVRLAFLWHQHLPYYPDDVAGENPMPWVRLHATRDYWGMAQLLLEVPEFKATINLVPSLLVQLRQYTEAAHEDAHLRVSRLPADGLSADDMTYLLDNFFMVHPDHNIRPFARYNELYEKRGLAVDTAARAAKRFSKRDVLDLQCWSNLVWMHPLAFELDPELAAFRTKGQHWTETEKQWLLAKQMQLLKEVIPLHKKLSDRGQVELSTTPFYHPILPLLWDKRLARQAMPGVVLPKHLEGVAEKPRQIKSARRSSITKSCSARSRAGCGPPKDRSPNRSSPRLPPPASNGSPPTRRFSPVRLTAGYRATAKDFCAIRKCSIAPGTSRKKESGCRSCFAIMR